MTITVGTLSGEFGYPPRVVGHIIKNFWTPSSVGEADKPNFLIPITDSETKDPWFSGEAPEIVFRHNGVVSDQYKAIGNVYKITYGVRIHLFCATQLQEYRYQKHINDIIKENRIRPILKYYETGNPDSGLLQLKETGCNWRTAPDGDLESVQEISHTHSFGDITAEWYEYRI